MRLLWIATKPPLPPVDGGRLIQKLTLEALDGAGVEVILVAPRTAADRAAVPAALESLCTPHLVPVAPRRLVPWLRTLLPGGPPLALARHDHPAVRRTVAGLLAGEGPAAGRPFDLVHVEQLHALPQATPAFAAGVPVVLRAQNVESHLWRGAAGLLPWPLSLWLRSQASRLARREARAVRRVAAAVALSGADREALEGLAGRPVATAAAPFPGALPRGVTPLAGDPPVVVLGSGGWLPNSDATAWMRDEVWPAIRRRVPRAVLHLFGPGQREEDLREGVIGHPPPADSATAFARGGILAVPLRLASGVRMKILEAWARGVPVVATPTAAGGLAARHGRELLLADDPDAFATAVARLAGEPELWGRLVDGGRAAVAARHDPARVTADLLAVYRRALATAAAGEEVDSVPPP